MTNLSAALFAWRQKHEITQKQAAEHLDVPLRTYQGWEAGRLPERPRILLLAIGAVSRALEHSR